MDLLTKRDLKISVGVGLAAGLLILPTLNNIGVPLGLAYQILIVAGLTALTPFGYLVAYWLSPRFPILRQFVKFGIVGGLNSMLDLGILNLLIHSTGVATGLYFSFFKTVSFSIAVTNSYFWNKYWTFHSEETPRTVEFFKFLMVNLVGLGINVGSASFVVNVLGAPAGVSPALWANIGAISSVFISLFWNFIGMKFIVFRK
ncbi:MAG: GtrA family protein [bacterium]|nr:GtrA family protein [bacterium]